MILTVVISLLRGLLSLMTVYKLTYNDSIGVCWDGETSWQMHEKLFLHESKALKVMEEESKLYGKDWSCAAVEVDENL